MAPLIRRCAAPSPRKRGEGRVYIGEIRAFYDVVEGEVHVLAIMTKTRAVEWLSQRGIRE